MIKSDITRMLQALIGAFAAVAIVASPATGAQSIGETDGEAVLVYASDYFVASAPSTARDMVSRLPGFQIDDGDSVRGFAGAGGNVLIDGSRPASKAESVSSVLNRTEANRVDHIQLIRGGMAGIDMQGHSVVANVVLKDESSRQHTAMVQSHVFDGGPTLPGARYDFNASERGREWGFNLARTVAMNDSTGPGTQVRLGPLGGVLKEEAVNNTFDGGGWAGRANWAGPLFNGRMALTGGVSRFRYADDIVYSAAGVSRRFGFEQDVVSADLGLRTEHDLTDRSRMELRLIQNIGRRDAQNIAIAEGGRQNFDAASDTGESIARGSVRWQAAGTLSVESGAEVAYNVMDTRQQFTVDGAVVELPQATTRVTELRSEVFSLATWQYSASLSLEAGARLERSTISQTGEGASERTFVYAKPRFAAAWDVNDAQQLRFRLERELGQLDFSDFAASSSLTDDQLFGGNVNLRPQQRWIAEAVYEHRFTREGVFTLTVRHDEISDVVDVIPLEDGLTATGNIGDGTVDRAAVNLRLPLRYIGVQGARLTLNAQYDHTRVTDPATGIERPISGVRPFTGSVKLEQDVPQLNLTWGLDYTPYFRDTTYNPDQRRSMELRDYVSVFGEYTISQGFTARLQLTVWNDFRINRDVWSDRETRQLAYSERLRIDPREFFQLRLRKTF